MDLLLCSSACLAIMNSIACCVSACNSSSMRSRSTALSRMRRMARSSETASRASCMVCCASSGAVARFPGEVRSRYRRRVPLAVFPPGARGSRARLQNVRSSQRCRTRVLWKPILLWDFSRKRCPPAQSGRALYFAQPISHASRRLGSSASG